MVTMEHHCQHWEPAAEVPSWLVPYVERVNSRYPNLVRALGRESLHQGLHQSASGARRFEMCEVAGHKIIRACVQHTNAPLQGHTLLDAVFPWGLTTPQQCTDIDKFGFASAFNERLIADLRALLAQIPKSSRPEVTSRHPSARDSREPQSPRSPGSYQPWLTWSSKSSSERKHSQFEMATAVDDDHARRADDIFANQFCKSDGDGGGASSTRASGASLESPEPESPRTPGNYKPWLETRVLNRRAPATLSLPSSTSSRHQSSPIALLSLSTDQQGLLTSASTSTQFASDTPTAGEVCGAQSEAGSKMSEVHNVYGIGEVDLKDSPVEVESRSGSHDGVRSILRRSSSSISSGRKLSLSLPEDTPQHEAAESEATEASPQTNLQEDLDSKTSVPEELPMTKKRASKFLSLQREGPTQRLDKPRFHSGDLAGKTGGVARPSTCTGDSLSIRRGLTLTSLPSWGLTAQTPAAAASSAQVVEITNETRAQVAKASARRKVGRNRFVSGGHGCTSPENKQPAVQLLSRGRVGEGGGQGASDDEQPIFSRGDSGILNCNAQQVPRPRCLPGAFQSCRTVFFFDWDDTLCPTTWIRSVLKEALEDLENWAQGGDAGVNHVVDWREQLPTWFNQPLPDEPGVREKVADVQAAVINLINAAQAFGVVCIVTNAFPGWVDKTIKRWLPELKQYIYGHGSRPPIRVLYGQQAYEQPPTLDELPWLDALGEHMWWKHGAMTTALCEVEALYRLKDDMEEEPEVALPSISWCTNSSAKYIKNVISMGDNNAEMQAAQLAAVGYKHNRCNTCLLPSKLPLLTSPRVEDGPCSPSFEDLKSPSGGRRRRRNSEIGSKLPEANQPWVKLIKVRECSHVHQLRLQLEEITDVLPHIVALRQNFRIDLDHGGEEARSPISPEHFRAKIHKHVPDLQDVQVGKSMLMQTV